MITECSRLLLERYAGGELDESERTAVRRHLDTCSDCSSFVAQLEAERADFLRERPFSSFTRAHAPLMTVPWYRRVSRIALQPALVPVYTMVLLILVVLPLRHAGKEGDVRFKGKHVLSFIYERNGIIRDGIPNLRFRANDRIQILYSLARRQYIGLLSIDSRGTVSFYHPDQTMEFCSVITDPGNRISFPGSIILDDTPGDELIIALFSNSALRTSEVAKWFQQQFTECPDPGRLQDRLRSRGKVFNADIATLLLSKE